MNLTPTEVIAIVAAVTAFVYLLSRLSIKTRRVEGDTRKLREDYKRIWLGIVARGFLEAQKSGFLSLDGETWNTTDEVREVYSEIRLRLRVIYRILKRRLDREPTDAELGWYIELDEGIQQWMFSNGCPQLGLNQHGCIALAAVIAREDHHVRAGGED